MPRISNKLFQVSTWTPMMGAHTTTRRGTSAPVATPNARIRAGGRTTSPFHLTRADSSPRVGVASRVSVAMSKMTEKAALLPPVQGWASSPEIWPRPRPGNAPRGPSPRIPEAQTRVPQIDRLMNPRSHRDPDPLPSSAGASVAPRAGPPRVAGPPTRCALNSIFSRPRRPPLGSPRCVRATRRARG